MGEFEDDLMEGVEAVVEVEGLFSEKQHLKRLDTDASEWILHLMRKHGDEWGDYVGDLVGVECGIRHNMAYIGSQLPISVRKSEGGKILVVEAGIPMAYAYWKSGHPEIKAIIRPGLETEPARLYRMNEIRVV